jgi:hypothetical protein
LVARLKGLETMEDRLGAAMESERKLRVSFQEQCVAAQATTAKVVNQNAEQDQLINQLELQIEALQPQETETTYSQTEPLKNHERELKTLKFEIAGLSH